MRRKLAVLVAAALMAMMVAAGAMPAFAQGLGPSACSGLRGYQGREFIARGPEGIGPPAGYSGAFNPGNSNNIANEERDLGPLIPYAFNCNPPFGD